MQASRKDLSSAQGSSPNRDGLKIESPAPVDVADQQREAQDMVATVAEQELRFLVDKYKLEAETYKNKLDQQKIRSRDLQLNLAGKIVVLEEKIEKMNNEKEEQIKQLELAHAEELQRSQEGVK